MKTTVTYHEQFLREHFENTIKYTRKPFTEPILKTFLRFPYSKRAVAFKAQQRVKEMTQQLGTPGAFPVDPGSISSTQIPANKHL